MIVIYTDGSCFKNGKGGPGGWAAVISKDTETPIQISGGEQPTTNNRMEMKAVVESLKYVDALVDNKELIEVYSDSAYIVNCFRDGWWKKWCNNGWINSAGKPVENKDLWEAMLKITSKKNVEFKKVKGHSDSELNNLCDELARTAALKV